MPSYQAGFSAPTRTRNYAYPSLWRGCVGAWCPSLGQTGGTLYDQSGCGNHGTLTNMDPGTDWVASNGKVALDFDGTDDYVSVANSRMFGKTSATFSFWTNQNAATNQTIISSNTAYNGGFLIAMKNPGIQFYVSTKNTNTTT